MEDVDVEHPAFLIPKSADSTHQIICHPLKTVPVDYVEGIHMITLISQTLIKGRYMRSQSTTRKRLHSSTMATTQRTLAKGKT